ncbi:trypsin-like peptidase domain-containing protein [bacterium]|nr:trypsin-like peptidase domain-containing protein [bacterium]
MRYGSVCVLLVLSAGMGAAAPEELQEAIFRARDAVLPALVHLQPISEVYVSGERRRESSVGSGVLFDDRGHVVTNYHVAGKAQKLICTLANKERISGELVGGDPYTDIAVIRLKVEDAKMKLVPARLGDSDRLEVGQYVLALGSPLALSRTVSCGVISCLDRYLDAGDTLPTGERTGFFNTWIQTDAAINPGNSGGPLVNLSGEVVGINARAYMFADNLGFAIPINLVKRIVDEILREGRVTRSWTGLSLQPLQELGSHFGVDERVGVLVSGIDPGSPAIEAGIETGDIMTEFDGRPTTARFQEEVPAIAAAIADTSVGKEVVVKLLRGGQAREVKLTTKPLGRAEGDEFAASGWGFAVKGISRQMMLDDETALAGRGARERGRDRPRSQAPATSARRRDRRDQPAEGRGPGRLQDPAQAVFRRARGQAGDEDRPQEPDAPRAGHAQL